MAELTVRDALKLPALRRALPEVLAGEEELDRPVRWAHVAEISNIASLLKGGELLLTTGIALPADAQRQREYAAQLARRGIAALVVELGAKLRHVPEAVVAQARHDRLPLVALRRETLFVDVTEQIHAEILAANLAFLRRAEEIHRRFTELMLSGAGVDAVLKVLAETIADPVVLEDAGGGLMFHARHRAEDADVMAAWELVRAGRADVDAHAVEVPGADRAGSGRLIGLALDTPLDDFDRVAVERAAGVIALASLRTDQRQLLALKERAGFLRALAAGDLSPHEAQARAQRLSFPRPRSLLVPVVVATERWVARGGPAERAAALTWRDVGAAMEDHGFPAMFGVQVGDATIPGLVALARGSDRTAAADALSATLAAAFHKHFGIETPPALVVGEAVGGWDALPEALREALALGELAGALPARPWHDATRPDLDRLLVGLVGREDVVAFAERQLAALDARDARRHGDLLETLDAFLRAGGSKAQAAKDLHIGRQGFYRRLTRIAETLQVDLDDPDVRLSLHLALHIRRMWRQAGARTSARADQTGRAR
jgi:PucR family transcriptional regulator, purine catabolism regulatory protein